MKYARKVDITQSPTVQAFLRAGWSVLDTSRIGGGAPDLFVSKRGVTVAIECKTAKKQRRENQIAWADDWRGEYLWGNDPLQLLEMAEAKLEGWDR